MKNLLKKPVAFVARIVGYESQAVGYWHVGGNHLFYWCGDGLSECRVGSLLYFREDSFWVVTWRDKGLFHAFH